jgi:hypothetical protein
VQRPSGRLEAVRPQASPVMTADRVIPAQLRLEKNESALSNRGAGGENAKRHKGLQKWWVKRQITGGEGQSRWEWELASRERRARRGSAASHQRSNFHYWRSPWLEDCREALRLAQNYSCHGRGAGCQMTGVGEGSASFNGSSSGSQAANFIDGPWVEVQNNTRTVSKDSSRDSSR